MPSILTSPWSIKLIWGSRQALLSAKLANILLQSTKFSRIWLLCSNRNWDIDRNAKQRHKIQILLKIIPFPHTAACSKPKPYISEETHKNQHQKHIPTAKLKDWNFSNCYTNLLWQDRGVCSHRRNEDFTNNARKNWGEGWFESIQEGRLRKNWVSLMKKGRFHCYSLETSLIGTKSPPPISYNKDYQTIKSILDILLKTPHKKWASEAKAKPLAVQASNL